MKSMSAGALSVALTMISGNALAEGDVARGERLFNQQCKACHTLGKGGSSPSGPNLYGLFGRKAGTAEGFAFSEPMKASGIVWDDQALTEYLKDPKAKVPKTTMTYIGLRQEQQQQDMVAFLKKATQ